MLRLHSAVFTELLTFLLLHAVTPVGVLVRAFQGVTPSFDSSDYQFSQTGHFSPSVVAMTYSFIDKFISSLAATIVGVAVSMIGYVNAMPQATDAFSRPILHTALFLWLGMPILGFACTLVAMKFYKLDKETMAEVQKKNAEIRAKQAAD